MSGAVVHAVASGGLYGIEKTLTTLLPALIAAGQPTELLCLNVEGSAAGAVGAVCEQLGVRVTYQPLQRGLDPRDLLRLHRSLGAMNPALLHTHGYKAAILAGAVALFRRIPVMGSVHSERRSAPELVRNLAVETQLLKRFPQLAAVSRGVQADLIARGVAADKICVVHNGISDPGTPAPFAPDAPFRLAVVGRLVEPKNVQVAIRALAQLAGRGLRPRMAIIGDGPELASLGALATAEGVADFVDFMGYVHDVPAFLTPETIFVMPSRSEGIPISLLEAMSRGVPIVATTVGGIPEVISDGAHALLVPPDDAHALATAIERLLRHRELAKRLATAARARYCSDFRVSQMRDRYLAMYHTLVPALR